MIAAALAAVLVLTAIAVTAMRARMRAEDRLQATLGEIGRSMERLSVGLLAVVERVPVPHADDAYDLAGTLDLDETLRRTASAACRLSRVDASAVRVTREDGTEAVATHGLAGGATGLEAVLDPPDRRPWQAVTLSWLHEPVSTGGEEPLRTGLAVPIAHEDERLGTLAVYARAASAFTEDDAEALRALARDAAPAISNARRYLATLDLVTTDALTGLRNRRGYDEALAFWVDRSRRTQRPLSLVLVDLDDFGQVNKRFSLPAGDAVLVTFAQALRDAARASDIVCRRGGEEFTVILPETECTEARRFHQRLRVAVAGTDFPYVDTITFSAGLTELREGDEAADLDLRISELANRRKAEGKDGLHDDCS